MRKLIRIFFILTVTAFVILAILESGRNRIGAIIEDNISVIEKKIVDVRRLDFQINYLNILPVGKAYFNFGDEVKYEGNTVYQLYLAAEDIAPFSWFKPAKAEIFSYVDRQDFLPYKFVSRVEMEKEMKEDQEILYNHKEQYMLSEGNKYKIFPLTHDPLSLIFYLIKQDFSEGKSWELNLNSNQSNYRVDIEVKDKKRYPIQGKDYWIWELSISSRRRKGETMRHSFDARAYFLDSPAMKIPLLVKASTNLGPILLRFGGPILSHHERR